MGSLFDVPADKNYYYPMPLIDLSHPLAQGQPPYPGDPELSVTEHSSIAATGCNVSRICIGSHQGTHLDAMHHIFSDGRTIDQMPLGWFYGPARVLRLPRQAGGAIRFEDLSPFESELQSEAKIILATGWDKAQGQPGYFTSAPSLSLAACRYLVSRKIRLLGMDMPSPGPDWQVIHQIFLARDAETVLVEGLANLDLVPDEFTFIGFPLPFHGLDGSPIRAVAAF